MRKPRRSHRNDLGSLFAASVIVVLGAAVCSMMFAAGDPNGSWWLQLAIITVAVVFIAALIGVRVPRVSNTLAFWNALSREQSDRDLPLDYTPQSIRPKDAGRPGQQKPVTAEEVRDIRLMSHTTWVPSREPPPRPDDQDVLE